MSVSHRCGFVLACGLPVLLALPFCPTYLQVALFVGYALAVVWSVARAGPLHPAAWFSVFLCLYSINYPLFMLTLGVEDTAPLRQVLTLNFAALCAFLLGTFLIPVRSKRIPPIRLPCNVFRVLIWLLGAVCLIPIAIVLSLDLGSKREVVDRTRELGISPLFLFFQLLTISAMLYLIRLLQSGRHTAMQALARGPFLFSFVILVLAFGVTGERDLIFRFLLMSYLIYALSGVGYTYRFWHYPALGAAAVYALPIFQGFKGILLPASAGFRASEITSIYWNEFASAGRNLHNIVVWEVPFVHGETFMNALLRYLDFLGTNALSSTQWYNQVVRVDYFEGGTSGWGFSLVADAYINFGMSSVVIAFVLVGMLSSLLWLAATRSVVLFVFYLMYVPTLIYVIRADFANFLVLTFKVNIILVGAVWVLVMVLSATARKSRTAPA